MAHVAPGIRKTWLRPTATQSRLPGLFGVNRDANAAVLRPYAIAPQSGTKFQRPTIVRCHNSDWLMIAIVLRPLRIHLPNHRDGESLMRRPARVIGSRIVCRIATFLCKGCLQRLFLGAIESPRNPAVSAGVLSVFINRHVITNPG